MNERFLALLAGDVAPGVYRFTSQARPAALVQAAEQRGWRAFHLDGEQIASKAAFLAAVAQALHFPRWSGNNWDALEDNLRDLSWLPARRGSLLVYDDAGILAAQHEQAFSVALDVLHSTVGFWRETSTPLVVLLRGLGRAGASLPRL